MELPAAFPKREGGPRKVHTYRYVIVQLSFDFVFIIFIVLSAVFFQAAESPKEAK